MFLVWSGLCFSSSSRQASLLLEKVGLAGGDLDDLAFLWRFAVVWCVGEGEGGRVYR